MKNKIAVVLMVLIALLTISIPAFPHHGTAVAYDGSKTVTMKGTVTEFVFKNPHIQLRFDVKDEKGKVVNWTAECGGVYFWSALGFRRDSLKPGDQITLSVHPSRIGAPRADLATGEVPTGRPVQRRRLNEPV